MRIKIRSIIFAFLPYVGNSVRFRICIRLHNFFRKYNLFFLSECLKAYMQVKYGCEISVHAVISPSAIFMHTVGIVIGEGCVIEDNVTLYSGVVIGRKNINDIDDYPIIRTGCVLCTGCKVLGKIILEKNTTIGANAVVTTNCTPEGGTYVGMPARRLNIKK